MNSHTSEQIPSWDGYNHLAYFVDDDLFIRKEDMEDPISFLDEFLLFLVLDEEDLGLYDVAGEEALDVEDLNRTIGECQLLSLFAPTWDEENTDETFAYCYEIRKLQLRYKGLMEFCLNQGLCPEELGHMTAYQRLNLYGSLPHGYVPQMLTSVLTLDATATDTFTGDDTAEQSPLERIFDIPAGLVAHVGQQKLQPAREFMLHSTSDILTLIFHELVLRDVKLKCCKHCHRYFVVKTKRNSDYCDRTVEGSTQTCQKLAAMEKFKAKKADTQAYQIFNLYYKRYHERKKVGTIKTEVFDTWNREACTRRDACIDGKGDVEAFEQWCHDSFSNRKRKQKDVSE